MKTSLASLFLAALTLASLPCVPASRADTVGTLTTLHQFTSAEGAAVNGLIVGRDGYLYGTNGDGGPDDANHGTVFRLATDGTVSVLHSFTDADGKYPGSLVQDAAGNLYGVTQGGGDNEEGTVFKLTPGGVLTTLHSFQEANGDGTGPCALIQGGDGNLYGVTPFGGANQQGTVFRVSPEGGFAVLCSFGPGVAFSAGTVVYSPLAALSEGQDGNLYVTTSYGGANGVGAVYRVSPGGTLRVLRDFVAPDSAQHNTEGAVPVGGLCEGDDGNFYGLTSEGGANGLGTIYTLSSAGAFSVLNTFDAYLGTVANYGLQPDSLIHGSDGNFYGVTHFGGADRSGSIFMMTPGGNLTILVNADPPDSVLPARLVQDDSSHFYGLTLGGGIGVGTGTAFTLTLETVVPTVSLTTTTPKVHVDSGETGEVVVSIPHAQTEKVVVHFTISGNAVNGTDYAVLSGKTKIKPGKTSRTVAIVPQGTLDGAAKKAVKLTLLPGADYTVGDAARVKIKLLSAGQ